MLVTADRSPIVIALRRLKYRAALRVKAWYRRTWWSWIPRVWIQIWSLDQESAPPAFYAALEFVGERTQYDERVDAILRRLTLFGVAIRATLAIAAMPLYETTVTAYRWLFTVPVHQQFWTRAYERDWEEARRQYREAPAFRRYFYAPMEDWHWPAAPEFSGEWNYEPENKWASTSYWIVAYGNGGPGYCMDCIGHHDWEEIHLDPRWWSLKVGVHRQSSC